MPYIAATTKLGRPIKHGGGSSYSRFGCRCEECVEAHSRRIQKQRATRQDEGTIPESVKHGLATTYTNWGCRCLDCKTARKEALKRGRAARKAIAAAGQMPDSIGHGVSTYVGWSCRCDVCRDAMRLYNAERRHQQRDASSK